MSAITAEAMKALVGEELGVSDWLTVDQAMIDRFAEATGDRQFIHVDPERAATTPFGGTIAHGFLTLSLYPVLREGSGYPRLEGARMGLNYGCDRLRFLTPVRSGSRVRGRFRLLAFEEKQPGRYQETIAFTVEIEGEAKPALVAEWLTQILL